MKLILNSLVYVFIDLAIGGIKWELLVILCQITDQLKRFSRAISLPQICENFEKAADDPRVEGIYIHIDSLNCGWGKLEEIRRHMLDFKKSGTLFELFCCSYDQSVSCSFLNCKSWKVLYSCLVLFPFYVFCFSFNNL